MTSATQPEIAVAQGSDRSPRRPDVPPGAKVSRTAADQMDALRTVAALLVVAGHLRALYFVPWEQVAHRTPLLRAIYLATSLGRQAVMVFFVLSGFLITSSVLRAVRGGYWSWRWYLARRLSRLWIVLVPSLVLSALWDSAGMRQFAASGAYSGDSGSNILYFAVTDRMGVGTFLGNVAFLQDILVPCFGSNGPLWSLANEWWYYVVWAAVASALFATSVRGRVAASVAAVAILVFTGAGVAAYFPIWLLGLYPALAPQRDVVPGRAVRGVGASVLLGAALVGQKFISSAFLGDAIVAVACAVLLRELTHRRPVAEERPTVAGRVAKTFASFSYTLYLVHLSPLVYFYARRRASGIEFYQPTASRLAVAGLALLAVVLYAYVISLATERHTDRLRRRMEALLASVSTSGTR